jgi:hypothetical protein
MFAASLRPTIILRLKASCKLRPEINTWRQAYPRFPGQTCPETKYIPSGNGVVFISYRLINNINRGGDELALFAVQWEKITLRVSECLGIHAFCKIMFVSTHVFTIIAANVELFSQTAHKKTKKIEK